VAHPRNSVVIGGLHFQKKENSNKKARVGVRIILKRLRVKANDKELVKKLKMEDEQLRHSRLQRAPELGDAMSCSKVNSKYLRNISEYKG
jgi:hypothetical protein